MITKTPQSILVSSSWLIRFCVLLIFPFSAQAQLCFDIFQDVEGPSWTCSDARYYLETQGGLDNLGGSNTGLLDSYFDGFDLFDPQPPGTPPPDHLLDPFFSDAETGTTTIDGQINSFAVRQRGSVSAGALESLFQNVSRGSKTRITFIPFTTDGSTGPVVLDLDFDFDFTLRDPEDNATSGGASGGAGAQLFSGPLTPDPEFMIYGEGYLDLSFDDEPVFSGDFDGSASAEPSGLDILDEFDIGVEFELDFTATPGDPLTLETDSFGSVFSDGFESGDTSAWSSTSDNTFVFSVSSANPKVRFEFVLTPPDSLSLSRVHRFISFDSDAKDDVLLRDTVSGQWLIDFMNWRTVRPNSGPTQIIADPDWEMMATGGFNLDSKGDVLLRNKDTGAWSIYIMNGRVAKGGATSITDNLNWLFAGLDDFDGDGKDDVLLRHRVTGLWQINFMNWRQVRPKSGLTKIFAHPSWEIMGTGDFNRDGRGDVLLRNKDTGAWWINLMNGRSFSGGGTSITKDLDWIIAGIDDFDGDGKDDVLLRHRVTGLWQINFMNWRQVRPNSGSTGMFTHKSWEIMGTGDFNRDGRGDVLLRNKNTGVWWMYLMNGRTANGGKTLITTDLDWITP